MILTKKSKKDFDNWNYDNDFGYIDTEPKSLVIHFEDLDENLRNTIIIEFLDSKGIYIDITPIIGEYECVVFGCVVNGCIVYNNKTIHKAFNTRNEAINQAIIKANEIYNEMFK